jgi:uncharacterized protein (DUF362 family)
MKSKVFFKMVIILLLCATWFYWDFSQAGKKLVSLYRSFKLTKDFGAVSSATTKVSIVRSDDATLAHPRPINDANIDYQTIEDMVRRAIQLAGGLDWIIKPGNMVLLKPNIVDPEPPGSGEVTDVRVVKALIKIIDELAPGQMEIVVGEGAPRPMDYEMKFQSKYSSPQWEKLWDKAGYQDLLIDPYLQGINFRLSNLNGSPPEDPWQDLVLVNVPGGGEALPQGGRYYIHKDVLNADVYITVPVMKIHTTCITVALKNQIGLAPSTRYGFSKTAGVPQDNYQTNLIHDRDKPKYWTDKEIVDLSNLAKIKFVVVDAIAGLESQKTAEWRNGVVQNLLRMNTIVAGADPVAVDHICARLMGLNPDDIEHITLAERVGLGTNDPDNINIVGADLEQTKRRFKKNSSETADFGQSNREWLINGTYSIQGISDPIHHAFIENESNLAPDPGKDGWSESIYFTDDRIDLKNYFNNPGQVVSYAFAYFNAPKDQEAELWIGSDEALKIYINGEVAYLYDGTRSFPDNRFVSNKVRFQIKAGENRLLVKSLQKYGNYDFALNICEPETNPDFDGNRIWGLKFYTKSNITSVRHLLEKPIASFEISPAYPNPFNSAVTIPFRLSKPGRVTISIFNLRGQRIRTLIDKHFNDTGEKSITWDGADQQANAVSSGAYLVAFHSATGNIQTQKVVLLK